MNCKHIGVVRHEDCTGCFACMNICPVKAIEMEKAFDLAEYPVVDETKCVSCGICQSVCSVIRPAEYIEPMKCYAAYNDNDEVQKKCASGGIATTFANIIVAEGGVVYGAAIAKEGERLFVKHICADNMDEVRRLSGSKYVQSQMNFVYSDIKEQLKTTPVLFVGTPCQNDGLLHYLHAAKAKKENLITVDLICHGVPPTSYLGEYFDSLKLGEVDDVHFFSQGSFTINAMYDGKVIYKAGANTDLYFAAFLNSIIYRENCYRCKYAQRKRVSDITIGDFWKIDRTTLRKKTKKKISVVLINTKKGTEFWEKSKKLLVYEERPYSEAISGNKQLSTPSIRGRDRDVFVTEMQKGSWVDALKKTEIGKSVERQKEQKPNLQWRVKMAVKSVINYLKGDIG